MGWRELPRHGLLTDSLAPRACAGAPAVYEYTLAVVTNGASSLSVAGGTATQLLLPNIGAALDGATFEFNLTATGMSGLSVMVSLVCVLDSAPPPTGRVWVESAQLAAGSEAVYAVNPRLNATLLICWDGFAGGTSGVVGYAHPAYHPVLPRTTPYYPVLSRTIPCQLFRFRYAYTVSRRLAGTAQSVIRRDTTSAGEACVDAGVAALNHTEAYSFRVVALSGAGVESSAAELIMVADSSGAEPIGSPLVYTDIYPTGLADVGYQARPLCCRPDDTSCAP